MINLDALRNSDVIKDKERACQIVLCYLDEKSMTRVAKKFGATTNTVSKFLKIAGAEIRKQKSYLDLTDVEKQALEKDHANGDSLYILSQKYGLGRDSLKKSLESLGYQLKIDWSRKKRIPPEQLCLNVTYQKYKCGADDRGILFTLTKDQVNGLIFAPCFYCGRTSVNLGRKDWSGVRCNGIDRKDNNRGYEVDNVVSCCGECNTAKSNKTIEQFCAWIRLVYEYKNLINSSISIDNVDHYNWGGPISINNRDNNGKFKRCEIIEEIKFFTKVKIYLIDNFVYSNFYFENLNIKVSLPIKSLEINYLKDNPLYFIIDNNDKYWVGYDRDLKNISEEEFNKAKDI